MSATSPGASDGLPMSLPADESGRASCRPSSKSRARIVREGSEERTIELANLSRKTRSEKVRVSLARSTTELRVVSSGGLAGRLVPTEADLVDGAELRIELEEAESE